MLANDDRLDLELLFELARLLDPRGGSMSVTCRAELLRRPVDSMEKF